MKKSGFYIIKEQFFKDMKAPYLKINKGEKRPHYYCFKDSASKIYWMIPLSSKIDKYQKIVNNKIKNGKSCDIVHIAKLDHNKKSVFLIQDMFPITENYIEREYTIFGNHMILTSEHLVKEIDKKAKKVLALLKKGVKFTPTQPDIFKIYNKLTNDE